MWLLLIFIPFLLGAQPVPVDEVVTTGDKSYQSGSNKNPQFVVPAGATEKFVLEFTCVPNVNYTVRIRTSTDGGKTWSNMDYVRKATICKTPTLTASHIRAKPWPEGTIIETEIITSSPIKGNLDLTFRK